MLGRIEEMCEVSTGHYDFIVLRRATISRHFPFELNAHTTHTFNVWSLEGEKKYSWLWFNNLWHLRCYSFSLWKHWLKANSSALDSKEFFTGQTLTVVEKWQILLPLWNQYLVFDHTMSWKSSLKVRKC